LIKRWHAELGVPASHVQITGAGDRPPHMTIISITNATMIIATSTPTV